MTDIFAVPHPLPFANVFSIGDVLIALGVAFVLVVAMLAPAPLPAAGPPATHGPLDARPPSSHRPSSPPERARRAAVARLHIGRTKDRDWYLRAM